MLDLWGGLAFIPSLLYVYVYSIQLKLNTKQPQKKRELDRGVHCPFI